ncbi:MAG: hypothetical protein AAGF78_00945 [Pseudomonadota bacterium]
MKQCRLYKAPEETLALPMDEAFTLLKERDGSHEWGYILACRDCGQHFVFDAVEIVDFVGGDDALYISYIPAADLAEAERIFELSPWELLKIRPALRKDFPTGASKPTITWVF